MIIRPVSVIVALAYTAPQSLQTVYTVPAGATSHLTTINICFAWGSAPTQCHVYISPLGDVLLQAISPASNLLTLTGLDFWLAAGTSISALPPGTSAGGTFSYTFGVEEVYP